MRLLLFTVDDVRYAVAADVVVEMVRAVAITPLAGAPPVVEGLIDVRGTIVPVFDLRERFGRQTREVRPADHFVLVRTASRLAALHVDLVLDLIDVDAHAVTSARSQIPASDHVAGVAALDDGMAFIHDVETFLSQAESDSLAAALAARAGARTTGA